MTTTHSEPTVAPTRSGKAIAAGTVGNLVEWFDWSIYGFFIPFIAANFFPGDDPLLKVLGAVAVFGVGFLFRPLGGAVLGSFTDRHGRKAGMALTILLMAGASLAMALLPTYESLGVAATALLVVARCVQGFSAGGEFGASSVFMVENARPGRRATVGALQQISVGGGTLLAAMLATLMLATMSPEAITSWGWRLAFGLGALMGLIGWYLRVSISDTVPFLDARSSDELSERPVWEVFRTHLPAVIRVIAMIAAGTGLAQFWFVFLPTFAHEYVDAPQKTAQIAATIALAIFTALVVPFGWLADKIGRKPVLLFFAVGSAVTFWPLLNGMGPSLMGVLIPAGVSAVFLAAYAGCLAAMMAEEFPTHVRSAGVSLPYGVAVAIFGGLAPLLATRLLQVDQLWILAVVVVVLCVIGAAAYLTMQPRHTEEI